MVLGDGDVFEVLGHRFDRKPKYYLHGQAWVYDMIEAWNWREKGFLPIHGTWQEQPNFICEAFSFIDYLVSERQQSASKAVIAKAKHGRK